MPAICASPDGVLVNYLRTQTALHIGLCNIRYNLPPTLRILAVFRDSSLGRRG